LREYFVYYEGCKMKLFGQEVSPKTLGILGAGLGGILGATGGKGQTSGTQGYTGGIPDYTATRTLVPGAFDSTGRRPGEAGRRYFTDVDFTRGPDNAILGGAEIAAMNQAALEQQQAYEAAGKELLGLAALQQEQAEAAGGIAGTPAAPAATLAGTATTPTGTTTTPTGTTTTPTGTTTTQTPYQLIDVDGDYTQQERDIAAQAIATGETTIPLAAGRFGLDTESIIDALIYGGYQTPEQIVESLGYTGGVPGLMVELAAKGKTDPEKIVSYFGNNPAYPEYQNITVDEVSDYLRSAGVPGYAAGGMAQGQGYYLGGPTDGMADLVPATIDGTQPAALSDGEFVVPADVVSHLGNGNSDAGAQQLYSMMDRVRTERTGTTKQGPEINPTQMMPA
jgi:hypothetical protein